MGQKTRCGQCGKDVEFKLISRLYWCPKCKKFSCYECVAGGRICHGCGGSVNIYPEFLFLLSVIMGFILLFIGIISSFETALSYNIDFFKVLFDSWPLLIIGIVLLFIGVFCIIFQKRRLILHNSLVQTLPPGIIPEHKRPGHLDPDVNKKWRKARREATTSTYTADLFDPVEHSLSGNWDNPIFSKDERLQWYETTSGRIRKTLYIFIIVGVFSIILGLTLSILSGKSSCWLITLVGIIWIPFSMLFLWAVNSGRKKIENDEPAQTSVVAVTWDFNILATEIRAFLDGMGQTYTKDEKSIKDMGHTHHDYKYTFSDGNYIKLYHFNLGSEPKSVTIGYRCSHYQSARKLQLALDKYLVDKDLILKAK